MGNVTAGWQVCHWPERRGAQPETTCLEAENVQLSRSLRNAASMGVYGPTAEGTAIAKRLLVEITH